MKLPNLQRIVGYLQDKFRLRDWKIESRYEADPRDPATGKPVYGYMNRIPEIPWASLVIRPPASSSVEDMAEFLDTCVHEVGHCRLAHLAAQGGILEEENATHAIAGFITELLAQTPAYNNLLMKAKSKDGSMDDEKSAALAALALKAGELMASGAVPEEFRSILEQLIALASGGSAPEAPVEAAPVEGVVPEEPVMGLQKQEDDMKAKAKAEASALLAQLKALTGGAPSAGEARTKALEEKMAADREAAVDGLLDTRPELKPAQREHGRALGIEKGVQALRKYLSDVVPAKAEEREPRARLGLDAPPRRGGASSSFRPSGNQDMMRRLRVAAEPEDEISIPGCRLHDAQEQEQTGKLMTMSIWAALPALRKLSQADVQRRTRRAGGES